MSFVSLVAVVLLVAVGALIVSPVLVGLIVLSIEAATSVSVTAPGRGARVV